MSMEAVSRTTSKAEPLQQDQGRLLVSNLPNSAIAGALGDFYSWTISYSASGGDHILMLKNAEPTMNLNLVSAEVTVRQKNIASLNRVSGAGAGTDVTGVNWKFDSLNTGIVVAKQEATDVGTVTPIQCRSIPSDGSTFFDFYGAMVLSDGSDGISISLDSGGLNTCATIIGYFTDIIPSP